MSEVKVDLLSCHVVCYAHLPSWPASADSEVELSSSSMGMMKLATGKLAIISLNIMPFL